MMKKFCLTLIQKQRFIPLPHGNCSENQTNASGMVVSLLHWTLFSEWIVLQCRSIKCSITKKHFFVVIYRYRVARRLKKIGERIVGLWQKVCDEDTVHEVCCLGAVLCFAMCTLVLGNMMIELEYARRGIPVQRIPWAWATWEEIFAPFVQIHVRNGLPPV